MNRSAPVMFVEGEKSIFDDGAADYRRHPGEAPFSRELSFIAQKVSIHGLLVQSMSLGAKAKYMSSLVFPSSQQLSDKAGSRAEGLACRPGAIGQYTD